MTTRFEGDCTVGIAYLFCSFQHYHDETQKVESLLASILRQLAQDLAPLPDCISALFEKYSPKGTQPTITEISEALRFVIGSFQRIFIVIDALDECDIHVVHRILNEISDLQTMSDLNLLATSRFIPDIMAKLQGKPIQEIRAIRCDEVS